jgi:hypothetical protein
MMNEYVYPGTFGVDATYMLPRDKYEDFMTGWDAIGPHTYPFNYSGRTEAQLRSQININAIYRGTTRVSDTLAGAVRTSELIEILEEYGDLIIIGINTTESIYRIVFLEVE